MKNHHHLDIVLYLLPLFFVLGCQAKAAPTTTLIPPTTSPSPVFTNTPLSTSTATITRIPETFV